MAFSPLGSWVVFLVHASLNFKHMNLLALSRFLGLNSFPHETPSPHLLCPCSPLSNLSKQDKQIKPETSDLLKADGVTSYTYILWLAAFLSFLSCFLTSSTIYINEFCESLSIVCLFNNNYPGVCNLQQQTKYSCFS